MHLPSSISKTTICKTSGFRAGEFCNQEIEEYIPAVDSKMGACPYHRMIHLNKQNERVNRSCEKVANIHTENWFVLPAIQAWYYKRVHPEYKSLPPFSKACMDDQLTNSIDLIYPKAGARLYIPKDLNGKMSKLVFKAASRNTDKTIYWHLNNEYIGQTKTIHHLEIQPLPGKYTLTLVDELGNSIERKFEILEK